MAAPKVFALLFTFCFVFAHALPSDEVIGKEFLSFLSKYNKHYEGAELAHRYLVFKENYLHITGHNEAHANGAAEFEMAINEYGDLSWEEFKQLRLVAEPQDCSATKGSHRFTNRDLPAFVDWREKGIVSGVKNQGKCGSCWTFSTTGCLEAHTALKTGKAVLLSEQQLLDCAGAYDNHGCKGGLPSHAFEYIKDNGGLNSASVYPYEARSDTTQCRFVKDKIEAIVPGGSVNITAGSELELTDALANVGPVAVAFQVVPDFRFYKEGVYKSPNCKNGPHDVNHAVLAVGYGVDAQTNEPYYIVKNSWGEGWGNKGYFLMKRGDNMCGIATCASYPNMDA